MLESYNLTLPKKEVSKVVVNVHSVQASWWGKISICMLPSLFCFTQLGLVLKAIVKYVFLVHDVMKYFTETSDYMQY